MLKRKYNSLTASSWNRFAKHLHGTQFAFYPKFWMFNEWCVCNIRALCTIIRAVWWTLRCSLGAQTITRRKGDCTRQWRTAWISWRESACIPEPTLGSTPAINIQHQNSANQNSNRWLGYRWKGYWCICKYEQQLNNIRNKRWGWYFFVWDITLSCKTHISYISRIIFMHTSYYHTIQHICTNTCTWYAFHCFLDETDTEMKNKKANASSWLSRLYLCTSGIITQMGTSVQ